MKNYVYLTLIWILLLLVFFRHSQVPGNKPALPIKAIPAKTKIRQKTNLSFPLALTPKQRRLLDKSKAGFRMDAARTETELSVKKAELENQMEDENPDMKRIDELCGEIGILYGRKLRLGISYRLEIENKILTADQLMKLRDSGAGECWMPFKAAFTD